MTSPEVPTPYRQAIKSLVEGDLRVSVFYLPRRSQFIQMEVERKDPRLPRSEREKRRSLGHTDESRAITEAYEVFTALRAKTVAQAPPGAPWTLGQVVTAYLASQAFANATERVQRDRQTELAMCLGFEDWSTKTAVFLAQEDILRYAKARTSGAYKNPDSPMRKVSGRRAQAELATLRTACNWAYGTRVEGKRLISERVFDGLSIPEGAKPKQVIIAEPDIALLWAARHRHAYCGFGLALALAYVFGKRGDSIRHLLWSRINLGEAPIVSDDVLIPPKHIFWSPEHDKEDESGVFPMPDDLVALMEAWRDHPKRKVSRWVFAAPKNADMPVPRVSFQQWGNQAYKNARLVKPKQGGWHSFRRAFATRNNAQANTKAAMKLGGWQDAETFLRYQQPDSAELLQVLNNRALALSGA